MLWASSQAPKKWFLRSEKLLIENRVRIFRYQEKSFTARGEMLNEFMTRSPQSNELMTSSDPFLSISRFI